MVHSRAVNLLTRHDVPIRGLRRKTCHQFTAGNAARMDYVPGACNRPAGALSRGRLGNPVAEVPNVPVCCQQDSRGYDS